MPNILDQNVRVKIIQEIEGQENQARKEKEQKKFDIYNNNQSKYILDALTKEFSREVVKNMRTVTSINLTKRCVDELASIYKKEPQRVFLEASEQEQEQLEMLYKKSKANHKLKQANKLFKLHDQCALHIIPFQGKIDVMVLNPSQYDVIPDEKNPEEAYAYVVSSFDRYNVDVQLSEVQDLQRDTRAGDRRLNQNFTNESIADVDDYKASKRFHFWTKEFHFVTNDKGQIINPQTNNVSSEIDSTFLINPIGMLPFIDISINKNFQFFVRSSSDFAQFCVELGVLLSDTSNINRLQGYAQAVMSAAEKPEHLEVGPLLTLFLQLDPNRPELKPSFEFVSPSPNINSSIDLINLFINLFLSSKQLDSKTVSGSQINQSFSSGVEKFLAMVEKFEASQDDYDMFYDVEESLFKMFREWNNVLYNVPPEMGGFMPELSGTLLSPDIELEVNFTKPYLNKTDKELEESVFARIDKGLISKKKAIMALDKVNEEEATALLKEIDEEKQINIPINLVNQEETEESTDGLNW